MHVILCTNGGEVTEAIRTTLERSAGRLTVCESGLELLAAAGTLAADLVVLDLETPGLNGLLLVSAVQELAPGLPIVAVSTGSQQDVRPLLQKGVRYLRLSRGILQPLLAELSRRGGPVLTGPAR
jgi:CheY-like chemotaxis protein